VNLRLFIFVSLTCGWSVATAANSVSAAASSASTAKPATTASSAASARPKPAPAPVSDFIHVGGSDMLQTAVGEPLARYVQQHPDMKVSVELAGSVVALSGLKKGVTQLAIIASPVGQIPAPAEFKAVLFCYSADYIIVNKDNPLNALDLNQVASVFGTTQQSYTLWGQLHLTAEWAPRPIIAYSTSTDDGVVIELFKNQALRGTALKPTVRVTKSPQEMIKNVADNPNAIGLGGFDPATPGKVKVVLLALPNSTTGPAAAKDPVAPTPENVFSGAYPLRLPFYLVFNPADKARVLPLLNLILSPEFAGYLRQEHFIPLSDTERNRALFDLELDKPN